MPGVANSLAPGVAKVVSTLPVTLDYLRHVGVVEVVKAVGIRPRPPEPPVGLMGSYIETVSKYPPT